MRLASASSTKPPGIAPSHPGCFLLRAQVSHHGLSLLHVGVIYLPSKGVLVTYWGPALEQGDVLIQKSRTWRRKWQPTPVFLPGKVHGQRSLSGRSPWDYMTEHVCTRVEGDGLVAISGRTKKKKSRTFPHHKHTNMHILLDEPGILKSLALRLQP